MGFRLMNIRDIVGLGGRAVKVADHTMILKAHITFTHIPLA